jgi:hypothetical protein
MDVTEALKRVHIGSNRNLIVSNTDGNARLTSSEFGGLLTGRRWGNFGIGGFAVAVRCGEDKRRVR